MKLTTPLKFYQETITKLPGSAPVVAVTLITQNGVDTFFAEWIGAYGVLKFTAASQGVRESATIRMPYIPNVYLALQANKVYIAKNAQTILVAGKIVKGPNTFELFSEVENVREENNWMEFIVKRYEAK